MHGHNFRPVARGGGGGGGGDNCTPGHCILAPASRILCTSACKSTGTESNQGRISRSGNTDKIVCKCPVYLQFRLPANFFHGCFSSRPGNS